MNLATKITTHFVIISKTAVNLNGSLHKKLHKVTYE